MEFISPIPHKKARIEIIPLIDIMFFLLASFMMVSLSQVHMKGMKVNLPTGISGQTQSKREYVSLSVDKDGQIYFDKTPMEPNQVYDSLVRSACAPARMPRSSSAGTATPIMATSSG